ncbi:MAG: hypothetical protein R3336_02035, partial [Phycisphaeraceae bacterium]|nr:hypothetical protein [Phycisphaeraceae bacterium]
MIKRMCRLYRNISLVALLILAPISVAQAADRIPNDIRTAQQRLQGQQLQVVKQYISTWVSQLSSGDPEAVAEARGQLMEPTSPGASAIFVTGYSAEAARQLNSLLQHEQMLVRLNTMIVASTLTGSGVADMVVEAVDDPSPAVRYWAGRTVIKVQTVVGEGEDEQTS